MKKHWINIYLLISTILFLSVALICSFGFFYSEVSSTLEKYIFESIYLNTDFDFVAPSPSFEQVSSLEKSDNGIEKVTPYYYFNTALKIESESIKSNVIMLDDYAKLEYTPYNSKRLLEGKIEFEDNVAIVDYSYINTNDCSIGDKVYLQIGDNNLVFEIVAVVETNTNYDGSIALIIPNDISKNIYDDNFKYSGAYIKSNNHQKCKEYLNNEYKPLGRLKDRSDFASDEAYDIHLNNFNNANWSQEITDLDYNYSILSIKYDNVEQNALKNNIILCTIYFIVIVVFNLFVIFLPSEKKMFREMLTKKKGKIKDIIFYNVKGNLYGLFVETIFTVLLMIIVILLAEGVMMISRISTFIIAPILVILIAFIFNIVISSILIKRQYSRK